ncbi:hypothetical protein ATO12_14205 [Aquimarina atlantica]|uniref:DUF4296 domain-containing protein n=1 Tax=Aquimarina atlantica TaxID=1317122 RepID=A0A023BVN6_9FLAO|nr:hypothetical protein [Aquimarina atlantica]EZH74025.1 hypothetical protein ATO12_14205 [Aquimarina atlantica]
MRKLLLFTFVISFLTVISCSQDEETTQVSLAEKEYLVKQTIIEFNNSAVKTGKYEAFIKDVSQKSVTAPLSQTELETMVQGFLGDQTQAFLDVYYQLVVLNLTPEEFYSIAYQFEYLRLNVKMRSNKNSGCCDASDSVGANYKELGALLNWACGCQEQ